MGLEKPFVLNLTVAYNYGSVLMFIEHSGMSELNKVLITGDFKGNITEHKN